MVGKCYPSWEIKIDKPDEHGIGEICTRYEVVVEHEDKDSHAIFGDRAMAT